MEGIIELDKIKIQESEITQYSFFELNNIPENIFPCCNEKIRILREYFVHHTKECEES